MLCRARRGRKVLEERIIRDEDRIQVLEKELEVTILFGEEADRKYEEVGHLYECENLAPKILNALMN